MNTEILKKPAFWVALIVAFSGIAVSQGLVVDGSTPAEVVGWVMTLVATFFGGKTSAEPAPAPDQTAA